MDETINIDKVKNDLQAVKKLHKSTLKRRQFLQDELNKLNDNICMLKSELSRKQRTLKFYTSHYEKLLLQLHNYEMQQNKARLTFNLNKNIIENFKHNFKQYQMEEATEDVDIAKAKCSYEKQKEILLNEKEHLQALIKENNAFIKQHFKKISH